MRAFEYARPETPEQAVLLLGGTGHEGREAQPVAGGSDLLALLKDGVVEPGRLVDLNGLGGLAGVARLPAAEGEETGRLSLGALTTIEDLAASEALAATHPAVAWSFGHVASPQIRAVGTLGGNLCQRPRCWYFRLGYGLLAIKDGESMVRRGDDRHHAILGNDGPALFVSPSTVAPLLIAHGAEATALGPDGERTFPLADLYRIPESEAESELTLAPGEILTRVDLPAPPAGQRAASYEIRHRKSLDWSQATAAVVLDMDGRRVRSARIVLGQVAPKPWRAEAAEAALVGKAVDEESAAAAADAAVADAKPIRSNGYKIQLARAAVRRALMRAAAGEES